MNIRDTHSELYTPIYDEFLLRKFDEYTQVHPKIFKDTPDTTKEYKVDELSGLGRWEVTDEGAAGDTEDPVLGYPKTYTPLKRTKTLQTSFEAVDDDEYALLKKEGQAGEMGIGARDAVEEVTSGAIKDGFADSGPDSTYLWSDSHPKNREETGTLYDNLLSGALSHDNLETAEKQITDNFFTMKGIPIPVTQDPILLYPPALRGTAERILNERALNRPTTTMRDINQFVVRKGIFKYQPVEWVYISAKMGGSDTAWFIIFPWLGYFKIIWRQKPHFVNWVDYNLDLYNFKGRMRFIASYDNWRGGFGSSGL